MRLVCAVATAVLALVSAVPVSAQEQQVTRRVFTFINNDLDIKVAADAPGVLRLARGSVGLLEVAARAPEGIAGFGLAASDGNRLTLTAVGSNHVDYLVVVPADVRVRVALPDRPIDEHFGSLQHVATYEWNGPAPAPPPPPPGPAASPAGGPYTAYAGPAPGNVSVPDARGLRTVTVRWEGTEFRVVGSRPVDVAPGAPGVEVRPTAGATDLVLLLPQDAADFVLRIGSSTALVLNAGDATTLCTPMMDQRLDGGRRWFTFTPTDGQLACRPWAEPPRVGP